MYKNQHLIYNHLQKRKKRTSGQKIVIKGRIAILSPLMMHNGFTQPWTQSNTWFLGLVPVSLQMAFSLVHPLFCRTHERNQQTYIHTDRLTTLLHQQQQSAYYAMHVMPPKMQQNFFHFHNVPMKNVSRY